MSNVIKILGSSFLDILSLSSVIESLQKVHLFKNFTYKKLENLSEKIGLEKYENGQKIISQGEDGNKFYIVKSGKVDIYVNKNYIRTLNESEYFGERALFFKEPRSATAIANGDVEIFYLSKENFSIIIENNLKDYLMNRLYLQDNTIELKDLNYIKPLGNGNYGQVSLVQSRKTKYFYAIKSMGKKQIDYEQLHNNIDLERAILLQIDHPFIVKLVKTLKDTKHIYFLMEFIKGKELFDVIREIGILNKYQTQFYGASMMLAVEYLHEKKFIYRDIKPENIIVVENVSHIIIIIN
jgi:cGMP-dependent protein kinase 1